MADLPLTRRYMHTTQSSYASASAATSGYALAPKLSGVNTNWRWYRLTIEGGNFLHDDRVRDRFCGMPVYNGTP